jgi:hypothetical protein
MIQLFWQVASFGYSLGARFQKCSREALEGRRPWWKAHPVEVQSTVVAADRPHSFAFVAGALGVCAERTFTIRSTPDGLSTVVVSLETQCGQLPWVGRGTWPGGCVRPIR